MQVLASAPVLGALLLSVQCSHGSASAPLFANASALASFDYTAPALPADPITCALQWASGDARFTLVVTSVQLSPWRPRLRSAVCLLRRSPAASAA